MHEITENTTLEMKNVLSYRSKSTRRQLQMASQEIEAILKDKGVKRTGPSVSTTFDIDTSGDEPIFDMELLIPVDRIIYIDSPYRMKPVFRLVNAVKIRHEGKPELLQQTANELMDYIRKQRLTPVTSGYNVTIKQPSSPMDMDDLVVDLYIGVDGNIL